MKASGHTKSVRSVLDRWKRGAKVRKPKAMHILIPLVTSETELQLPIYATNPANGNKGKSWRAEHQRSKAQRDCTRNNMVNALHHWDIDPPSVKSVTLTRVSPGKMDSDGLSSSLKAVRDGVAAALGVSDADWRDGSVQWQYAQDTEGRAYGVRVRVFC